MKTQVARGGAGVQSGERRIGRHEFPGLGIESVDDQLVDAFVVDDHALPGRIERHVVRVRALLGRTWPRALVLAQIGHRRQLAVIVDRQDGHAAVLVVGDDQPASAGIGGQMARLAAAGRLAAELGQVAAGRVDGVGHDLPAVEAAALADGEQETPAWIAGQKRRIDFGDGIPMGQLAGSGVLIEDLEAIRVA